MWSLCSYEGKTVADEIVDTPETPRDPNAPQQPPSPPLPPTVKGNEDGEGHNNEPNRSDIQKTYVKPKHWTKYVEAICALALVFITFYYTRAAYRQAVASETAANAANISAQTADATLKEIQKNELASSDQFKTQLEKLDASIGQARRLADATEKANRNAENADRPWLGGQINVIGFEAGRNPEAFCAFVNGGRRPAFVEHQVCELVGDKMVPMPDVAGEYKPKGLVLPGGTVTMHQVFFAGGDPTYIQDGKMTSTLLSLYDSSQWHLRINSTVTYRDIGTGKIHHTTMCVRYQPAEYKSPASWTDCDTGNYAD
jgi:hypothetical protein